MPLPEPCPFRGRLLFGFGSRYNLNHAICESRRDPGNKKPQLGAGPDRRMPQTEKAPLKPGPQSGPQFCLVVRRSGPPNYTHKILFFWSNVKFFSPSVKWSLVLEFHQIAFH